MSLTPDDHALINGLCPELLAILDAELAAGNRVAATMQNGWGSIVMLGQEFKVMHQAAGRVEFIEVNDPHYWKAQYSVKELDQHIACKF